MQKYISKPDRKKLAERLGLKDSQVSYLIKYIKTTKKTSSIYHLNKLSTLPIDFIRLPLIVSI